LFVIIIIIIANVIFSLFIIYRATFVKSKETFWVGIRSPKSVLVKRAIVEPPILPPANDAPQTPLNVYDGCGRTKGCFGSPDGCIATKDCIKFVSYASKGQQMFHFELSGQVPELSEGDGYVALGFSVDNVMVNIVLSILLLKERTTSLVIYIVSLFFI
jgi:hypothetical protein